MAQHAKRCKSLVQTMYTMPVYGQQSLETETKENNLSFDVFENWGLDVVGPLPLTQQGAKTIYSQLWTIYPNGKKPR